MLAGPFVYERDERLQRPALGSVGDSGAECARVRLLPVKNGRAVGNADAAEAVLEAKRIYCLSNGATMTPQGRSPAEILRTTANDLASTTETSFDGPFAV